MQRHRMLQMLSLVVVLATLLAACGGGGTGATNAPGTEATSAPATDATSASETSPTAAGQASGGTSGEPVTITWGFWGEPAEKASHEKVAQAFMQEHPEIKIEIWHQPWADYFTKIKTLWASGDTSAVPDVLFLWPTPSYAATGVLENLDPWIQKSGYNLEDYWPALLESATYNGSVYGLPRDISVEVLYYNKTIFDEAGVAYPTENWTWDDLIAAAEKLTVVEPNGRVRRYGLGMEGGKYSLWINQNKGSIFDDMRNPSRCTLNDPPAVEAIKFFADMQQRNLAMPAAALSQAGGDSAVFQNGQVAMIIQNASRIPTFNEAKLNYDVAPVPTPAGGQRSASAGGSAWVMSAASDNKEAAWTFLQWLQSTEGGQRIYTENGDILPALRSTATSDVFLKANIPPTNRQAFVTEAENARVGRFGYLPEWDQIANPLIESNLQSVWSGETTAEQALPQICEQVDAFLKQNGYPK